MQYESLKWKVRRCKELTDLFHREGIANVLRLVPKDFEKSATIMSDDWYLQSTGLATFAK